MNRQAIYVGLNVAVALASFIGFSMHSDVAHPVYVTLLFALCSSPLLEAKQVNGPYSILVLWSADYFAMYGALDLRNLVLGPLEDTLPAPEGLLSVPELAILLGGALVQVAYRLACRHWLKSGRSGLIKDWPEWSLVVGGLVLWAVTTRLAWEFSVVLFTERSNTATKAGLESLGGLRVSMYMLARMAQPMSIMILAYAQCRYRRAYMVPLVFAIVVFQLIFGFIIDFKTEALIGGVLVVLTNLLVTGRVPKLWVGLMVVVLAVGFPILQANRVVRDERAQSSTAASQSVFDSIKRAMEATGRTSKGKERTQSALERLTTKTSVDIIVRGTGVVAPFQHGYTLTPMVTAFIPRLVWGDKPSIPTGQIMNKEFHVSAALDTYISPSHLGELYWNFGWAGVIVGMSIIGYLFGLIGARFNLAEAATLTRVLVVVVTVREVIIASEGEVATHYVVWMRSLLAIWLLHQIFARRVLQSLPGRAQPQAAGAVPQVDSARIRPFPNLLR